MMRVGPVVNVDGLRGLAAVDGKRGSSHGHVDGEQKGSRGQMNLGREGEAPPPSSPDAASPADQAKSPVIGRRVYTDGRTADFKQGFLSWFVAVVTLTLYTAWIPLLLVGCLLSLWYRTAAVVFAVLASTTAMPATMHWQPLLDSYVMRTWREYFNFSYVMDGGIDRQKSYILAEFPHGAFPLGPIVSMSAVKECLYGRYISGVGASILFWIPGYYHFLSWVGGLPATKPNIIRLLKKGWVAVTVGGIAEMFIMKPNQERIYLHKRKGIVRIAVQTGTDIIPVYHFGNTQVLSFGPQWLKTLSRRARASVGLMYGTFGLPIPRHLNIMMACGEPVPAGPPLDPADPGFAARVEEVHSALEEAMLRLFKKHAMDYGWEDRPLVIL